MTDMIQAPVSAGELIDKITILRIKMRMIEDPAKRANVERELAELEAIRAAHPRLGDLPPELEGGLAEVNLALWHVEDRLRDQEAAGDFGPDFVENARAVYKTNDRRAALKREINALSGSAIVEEKSYKGY